MSFPPRPAADETHVWIVDTALLEPHGAWLRALAGDDSSRALGRGFLRVLLGTYLGALPHEVQVHRRCPACGGGHGPPVAHELKISVSYTRGRVAYAISTAPVGVDIEVPRPGFAWRRVAPLVFSADEIEDFDRQPPADRATAFLQAWTRREAIGKAAGVGLADLPPVVIRHCGVEQIHTGGDYVAAVAHASAQLRVYAPIDVSATAQMDSRELRSDTTRDQRSPD